MDALQRVARSGRAPDDMFVPVDSYFFRDALLLWPEVTATLDETVLDTVGGPRHS